MPVDLRTYAVGGATRPDGLNFAPDFSTALANMLAAAPPEIASQLRIGSGYRSPERQSELYEAALSKYGSEAEARRWVAPPGRSNHNHGAAADLKYLDPSAREWAHANASQFGLAFPLSNEPWHVEPMGQRDGTKLPQQQQAPTVAGLYGAGQQTPQAGTTLAEALPGATLPAAAVPIMPVGPDPVAVSITAIGDEFQKRQDGEAKVRQARRIAAFAPPTPAPSRIGSLYG